MLRNSSLGIWNALSKFTLGTSLVVQWLRLHTPNAGGPGSIPGQIPRATTKSSHATAEDATGHN